MWILRWTQEQHEPLTFRLAAGSVKTIGRATRADFILDAALVSRVHCRLTAHSDARLEVQDLGSTNGTYVNGHRITRAELKEGDRLRIGRAELSVLKYEV
ncbi:MAG: FHA domain-containing protein [Vicinamibacterales bacterium]